MWAVDVPVMGVFFQCGTLKLHVNYTIYIYIHIEIGVGISSINHEPSGVHFGYSIEGMLWRKL